MTSGTAHWQRLLIVRSGATITVRESVDRTRRRILWSSELVEEVIVVVSMFIVGGILTLLFALGMVAAAVADRRRSMVLVADAGRFSPQVVDGRLPWSV